MATTTQILNELYIREIYPTTRFIPVVTTYMKTDQILEEIGIFTEQQLLGPRDLEVVRDEMVGALYPEVVRPFEIPTGNYTFKIPNRVHSTAHVQLPKLEQQLVHQVCKEVLVPTPYHTPKGIITVNFDIDRWNYISGNMICKNLDDLQDYLDDRMRLYQSVIFARYFVF